MTEAVNFWGRGCAFITESDRPRLQKLQKRVKLGFNTPEAVE